MSIEKVKRKNGTVAWRVRWREGGRNRARVLGRKRDAEAFDAEVRRQKRAGELTALEGGKETLADFAKEWFRVYAIPNLAATTLESYSSTWDRHVLSRLGGFPLRELRPEVVQGFAADLARAGVGRAAIRRTLMILSSVLRHAEDWGRITTNPVRRIAKPSGKRARAVRPLPPATVERVRTMLLGVGRSRDATLVSLLAYSGVRPGEALALTWADVRDRTLLVERSNAGGQIKATKTGGGRSVRLLAPLATDLAEWRLACGRPDDRVLVFPNSRGEPWNEVAYRNWRARVYVPVVKRAILDDELRTRGVVPNPELWKAATPNSIAGAVEWWDGRSESADSLRAKILDGGVKGSPWRLSPPPRPYDLRHSLASLLIHEGRSVVEVAAELGHQPSMTLDTYAHVFAEFKGAESVSAETQIRRARDELVPVSYLPAKAASSRLREIPANQ